MSISFSLPQINKTFDTLIEQGVTPKLLREVLLGQSVLSDVARAAVAGTIPPRGDLRQFLGLASLVSLPKKPLPFQKNQNGHYVVILTGASRPGTEEVSYLESRGFVPGDYAKPVLGSTGPDSYDAKHRLAEGQIYQVALVPGRDLTVFKRTTQNLQAYGTSFGYGKCLAGMMPRIRETVSDEQMEEMEFWYLAGLHDSIQAGGGPHVLDSRRFDGGRYLGARWVVPGNAWDDLGAFVFPVSPLVPKLKTESLGARSTS
jgi:hypothetical protein